MQDVWNLQLVHLFPGQCISHKAAELKSRNVSSPPPPFPFPILKTALYKSSWAIFTLPFITVNVNQKVNDNGGLGTRLDRKADGAMVFKPWGTPSTVTKATQCINVTRRWFAAEVFLQPNTQWSCSVLAQRPPGSTTRQYKTEQGIEDALSRTRDGGINLNLDLKLLTKRPLFCVTVEPL